MKQKHLVCYSTVNNAQFSITLGNAHVHYQIPILRVLKETNKLTKHQKYLKLPIFPS
jgi:hypothetical protein